MNMTTTFIKKLDGWRGDARLYRLPTPVAYGYDDEGGHTKYVVVSAASVLGTPETYIFATDAEGKVLSWAELPGSMSGTLDHEAALASFRSWSDAQEHEGEANAT